MCRVITCVIHYERLQIVTSGSKERWGNVGPICCSC